MRSPTQHPSSTRPPTSVAALRPGASLHRSAPNRPTRRRRLASSSAVAGSLLVTVTGLGVAGANASSAAPRAATAVRERVHTPASAVLAPRAPLAGSIRVSPRVPPAASRGHVRAALTAPARPAAGTPVGQSFTGLASWYGPGFQGRPTASGTPYDQNALTAASRTLPLGTHLRVCRAGACVRVLVNDWGPVPRSRVLDLSRAAAERLGYVAAGVAEVTATPVR